MDDAIFLVALGVLFLAGLALEALGRIIHVPRVTLMILLGALIGPPMLDLLPAPLVNADGLLPTLRSPWSLSFWAVRCSATHCALMAAKSSSCRWSLW